MKRKMPVSRQISWFMVIPEIVVMVALIVVINMLFRPRGFEISVMLGAGITIVYSQVSRRILTSDFRRGIRLMRSGNYTEAIPLFEKGFSFFEKYPWIDRFRCLVLMSSSAISYREIALLNIACCHAQLGNAELSKAHYEKAAQLFPDSLLAKSSLKTIETFERTPPPESPPSGD